MDCNWVVVAIKEEDKSKMEFSNLIEKKCLSSTLVPNNCKTVFLDSSYHNFNSEMLFRLLQSENRCHELESHVSKILSAVTQVFSN